MLVPAAGGMAIRRFSALAAQNAPGPTGGLGVPGWRPGCARVLLLPCRAGGDVGGHREDSPGGRGRGAEYRRDDARGGAAADRRVRAVRTSACQASQCRTAATATPSPQPSHQQAAAASHARTEATQHLARVVCRLDALDSDTVEARAASILHGLGFDKRMQVGGCGPQQRRRWCGAPVTPVWRGTQPSTMLLQAGSCPHRDAAGVSWPWPIRCCRA